jgi:hypothetical protein
MMKRWMVLLIVGGACQPQPAPQGPAGAGPEAANARWWCVYSQDGYSSNCERALVDCESNRKPPRRRAGACSPEPIAYCFRYVNKGLNVHGTIVNECAATSTNCEDRRAHLQETLQPGSVLGECESVK